MSYIAPDSTIYILCGVPLDPEYINTTYYADAERQYIDFLTYRKYTLNEYSYQRADRGYLKVDTGSNHVADDLYNCNYMMFQNTNFGNKWFYAFIRSVEYVNNRTALIRYEIDVMQTWMFNYTMDRCLVIREHSLTDEIGENTVHEDVSVGETYRENEFYVDFDYSGNVYMLILCAKDGAIVIDPPLFPSVSLLTDEEVGILMNNTFSGLKIVCVSGNLATDQGKNLFNKQVGGIIFSLTGQSVNIVALCQIPANAIVGGKGYADGGVYYNFPIFNPYTLEFGRSDKYFNVSIPDGFSDVEGTAIYTPKNNKMLTSPFITLNLSNKEGVVQTYDLNKFRKQADPSLLRMCFSVVPLPITNYVLAPMNYDGSFNSNIEGTNPETFVSGAPLNPPTWTIDSYKEWMAQNGSAVAIGLISTLITTAITIGSGIVADAPLAQWSGVISGNIGISQAASSVMKAVGAKDSFYGSINNSTILTSLSLKGFRGCFVMPKKEYAKIIDDYFTMYGYAVNSLKVPNCRNANRRPVFNYTQISNCAVIPNATANVLNALPNDDMAIINRVFSKGVREWNMLSSINRYQLDNSPVVQP